jgi:glycosyltransferase involved in cell wall biosynthesis
MKAIVSVINDLATDQRVDKVCTSLKGMGYEVELVGRRQRSSTPLATRSYHTSRMFLLFEKGPLFYGFFQLRLFFFLLLRRADVLIANDLDTLLPNYLISRLRGIPLVYDTHELFCEVPELQQNPAKRRIWKRLEQFIFPKLNDVFTVNDSIAGIYAAEYGKKLHVLRNVPRKAKGLPASSRSQLGLPEGKKLILMQGAGINIQRGAEEAVEAMAFVPNAILLILGNGDVIPALKETVRIQNLGDKVLFLPRMPFQDLRKYTLLADIGLSLDKDTNLNYRYSLPNKIFDYIHAGVPVLASDLPEVKKIIEGYGVGRISKGHEPKQLAALLNEMLSDTTQMKVWKENTKLAAEKLCWEEEEQVLRSVYAKFMKAKRGQASGSHSSDAH